MMKILYVPSLNLGVVYWRIENYANEMVRQKIPVFVEYFLDPYLGYAWDSACVGKGQISHEITDKLQKAFSYFDVVIFQKIQHKEAIYLIQELMRMYPKVKVVAEIDDSLGDLTPSNFRDMKNEGMWAAEHCRISDGVICSTSYLAESIQQINKNTFVAPNCIDWGTWESGAIEQKDPERYKKLQSECAFVRKDQNEYRVVYVGGGGHDEDLEIVYEPMLKFLEKYENATWYIRYGGYRPVWLKDHPRINFEQVSWHISKYSRRLYELFADLALAPIRDTEFNRCKSALKWLEWASQGVKFVGSEVRPYTEAQGGSPHVGMYLTKNDPDLWFKTLCQAKEAAIGYPNRLQVIADMKFNLQSSTKALIEWLEKLCNNREESTQTKDALTFF